jgi:hypothetical protein
MRKGIVRSNSDQTKLMKEKKEEEKDICPACGAVINPDDDRCSSCQLNFKPENDIEPVIEKESDELITLFKLNDTVEAELMKLLLEDAGIPCIVTSGEMSNVLGASTSSTFSFASTKIMVPKSHARDALIALADRKKWGENELARYLTMLDEVS